jgi:hypothetical protein
VSGLSNKFTSGRFLSYQLAHYDEVLSRLAFRGPHEEEALRDAPSPWKGGTNAQDYMREKFVVGPGIAANPRPHASVGRRFLEDPLNRALHDQLSHERVTPDVKAPLKPSEASFVSSQEAAP